MMRDVSSICGNRRYFGSDSSVDSLKGVVIGFLVAPGFKVEVNAALYLVEEDGIVEPELYLGD